MKAEKSLFNDACHICLFIVVLVKNHTTKDIGNLLLPLNALLFLINSKGYFYTHYSIDRTVHTMAFCIPVMGLCLELKMPNIRSTDEV